MGKREAYSEWLAINRIGIQLQEEQRQVSIRISNIRYWDDLEQNCQTLYDLMVAKAHIEIELRRAEVKIQKKVRKKEH